MAEAIAIFLITETAGAAAAGGALLSGVTTAVGVGIAFGASALAQAFMDRNTARPEASPGDHQFIVRNPVAPRTRSYGRVRVAGAQLFMEAASGVLYRVLAHADGQIDGVEEHILGEEWVEIDVDGWVLYPSAYAGFVRIFYHTGSDAGLHYPAIQTLIAEWDGSHLGKGFAHSATMFYPTDEATFRDVYPHAQNTTYKQTIRGARVWDPRDPGQSATSPATWEWSDNLALIILDHLRHASGFALPLAWITPELDAWKAEADICDQPVPLKRGGTEPRWRGWGTYSYADRPGDVLDRLLSACNGKLLRGASGGIRLLTGRWVAPTVTLDDAAIVSYDIGGGNEGPSSANTLLATYTEPEMAFADADADPWVDDAAVAAYGEETATAQLSWVPSHGQCRRLMKQAAARLAPLWRGTLMTNLRGLAVMDQRFVTISIGELGATFTAEIDDADLVMQEGIVTGVRLQFVSMPSTVFDWDAATEEGTAPEVTPDTSPTAVVAPTIYIVEMQDRSGVPVGVAVVDYRDAYLKVELEYRLWGSTDWQRGGVSARGVNWAETPVLLSGYAYDFRARYTSGFGRVSAWSTIVTRTAYLDPTPPGAPTSLSLNHIEDPPSSGTYTGVRVNWTNPSSANTAGARVYTHTADVPGAATLIATTYHAADHVESIDHYLPATTTDRWYWVAAFNGSGVEGTRTSAGMINH